MAKELRMRTLRIEQMEQREGEREEYRVMKRIDLVINE